MISDVKIKKGKDAENEGVEVNILDRVGRDRKGSSELTLIETYNQFYCHSHYID